MIIGRKDRDRVRLLERIAATKLSVQIDEEEPFLVLTAEQAYFTARWGSLNGEARLLEPRMMTEPHWVTMIVKTPPLTP